MITFEIAGEKYEAAFKHTTAKDELAPGCRGTTECMVVRLSDGQPVMFAEAKAKVPDNFSRSLGRQISLGRALAGMLPDPPTPNWTGTHDDKARLVEYRQARQAVVTRRRLIVKLVARCKRG